MIFDENGHFDYAALDRADRHRGDGEFIKSALAREDAWVIPGWRGKAYVADGRPPIAVAARVQDAAWLQQASTLVFLGLYHGRPLFAADMSGLEQEELEPAGLTLPFRDLRMAGAFMQTGAAQLLGYARAITRWHRVQIHCESCASELGMTDAGFSRTCSECERKFFPRTDPAVMILITRQDQCLLARQPAFPPGMFSALAGFIEPGESLEDCVAREAMEEVGLQIGDIQYFGSQPWPFPHQLMVGFRCEAQSLDFEVDKNELETARWVTRAEILADTSERDFFVPPPLSLARHLIHAFANE